MQYIDLNAVIGLTDAENSAIREHCVLSGLITRMQDIRSFLIKEVHEKRSILLKNGRFRLRDSKSELNRLYSKVLFGGKKQLCSYMDEFPSGFRCYLDDILLKSVKRERDPALGFSICDVYYNTKRLQLEELQTALMFDKSEWELNDPSDDRATLHRFRDEFIEAMQHLVREVKRLGHTAKAIASLNKEIRRFTKIAS